MPPKPSPKDHHITVVVNGEPIGITLYSPRGKKKTWYAYWSAIESARSTKQKDFKEAVKVAEAMVRNGGKRPDLEKVLLSDEEFEQIQRRHFGKKRDPDQAKRNKASLTNCLEAIDAFKRITGLSQITLATPDDCENFQHKALKLPTNWRRKLKRGQDNKENGQKEVKETDLLSPSTVRKWSSALQAAFERANRNAGKKCVRGVVPSHKLLDQNPWLQFTWIEGRNGDIRQFDAKELISLINYFESDFAQVPVAAAFIKFCLWSWGRRYEVCHLKWSDLRKVGHEYHFEILGKWGIDKWARIPRKLYDELNSFRTDSPFVFSAYPQQLQDYYLSRNDKRSAKQVIGEFKPANVGEWVYRRVKDWQKQLGCESAYLHVFRKTTLQYARSGEDASKRVAEDARLSEDVMMTHYAKVQDTERRNQSNRTYRRILNSLPFEVARRYGYEETEQDRLLDQLESARNSGDWRMVAKIAERLEGLRSDGSDAASREIS